MKTDNTTDFLFSILPYLLGLVTAAVLLGLAIATVRALAAWRQDQRESFSKYRSDAFRILAVGVVCSLLLADSANNGKNSLGRKLYNYIADGTNNLSKGAGTGKNSLKPNGDSASEWTASKGQESEKVSSAKKERKNLKQGITASDDAVDEAGGLNEWNSKLAKKDKNGTSNLDNLLIYAYKNYGITTYDDFVATYKKNNENGLYGKAREYGLTDYSDPALKAAFDNNSMLQKVQENYVASGGGGDWSIALIFG